MLARMVRLRVGDPALTEIEMAQVDCWQHAYPGRVSDLRTACRTHLDDAKALGSERRATL